MVDKLFIYQETQNEPTSKTSYIHFRLAVIAFEEGRLNSRGLF